MVDRAHAFKTLFGRVSEARIQLLFIIYYLLALKKGHTIMVICFFSTQYLPHPRRVERYTWNLARRCVAAGHRALVVTASLPGLPARERDADGIEIYRLPSWPVMGGRFPVLKPLADADDLWAQGIRLCGYPDPDVHAKRLGRTAV